MSCRGRGWGRGGRSRRPETGDDGPAALDAAVPAATAPFSQPPPGHDVDLLEAADSADFSGEEDGDVATSRGEPQLTAGHGMPGWQGGGGGSARDRSRAPLPRPRLQHPGGAPPVQAATAAAVAAAGPAAPRGTTVHADAQKPAPEVVTLAHPFSLPSTYAFPPIPQLTASVGDRLVVLATSQNGWKCVARLDPRHAACWVPPDNLAADGMVLPPAPKEEPAGVKRQREIREHFEQVMEEEAAKRRKESEAAAAAAAGQAAIAAAANMVAGPQMAGPQMLQLLWQQFMQQVAQQAQGQQQQQGAPPPPPPLQQQGLQQGVGREQFVRPGGDAAAATVVLMNPRRRDVKGVHDDRGLPI
ncbi:hypothetical protein PLESTB_000128200 [Pleodorina starrii]|uniref:Uncharacterized protein n=1 Tax=Pleodorina starrii TaxID=330485 RepID=A0A9W6BAX3_9CHLO|nr:hypothetical protein PLESTB_000128200 [Pleodorina starrii]GLC74260.1 hypothetical protein PLESTF_001482100 [Pleodorina starrii]